MQQLFKVLSHGEAVTIQTKDGTSMQKSTLVLQELGGKYQDSYVCTLLGEQAHYGLGELVYAVLRFRHREQREADTGLYRLFQDITVQDIVRVKSL